MIDNPISDASDDRAAGTSGSVATVSVDDLRTFSIVVADLADAGVMGQAWR